MLRLNTSTRFKQDFKLCLKRGYDMQLLEAVIDTLRIPKPLPAKNRDHKLSGNHSGEKECHIAPGWLLIYRISDDELYLVCTGTHANLLNM